MSRGFSIVFCREKAFCEVKTVAITGRGVYNSRDGREKNAFFTVQMQKLRKTL